MRKILLLSWIGLAMILSLNYAIANFHANSNRESAFTSLEFNSYQPEEVSVTIYPNPLTEEQLKIEANSAIIEVEIMDILGKNIYKEQFEAGVTRTSISFKSYSKGLYIVKIAFEGKKFYTQKVLFK